MTREFEGGRGEGRGEGPLTSLQTLIIECDQFSVSILSARDIEEKVT